MALFSTSRYSLAFCFLFLHFHTLNAKPNSNSSFDFKTWSTASQFSIYGDAKLVKGVSDTFVHISGSVVSSAGRLFSRDPIKFIEGNQKKLVSFTTTFVFSMSNETGDGLAFVMVPNGYPMDEFDGGSFGLLAARRKKFKFIAVEFDTFRDKESDDVNDNHIGIDIDSLVSVKVRNVSSINLRGEKLQAWIDYEATSKRLEVRLSNKLGNEIRPIDPLISYPIDLSRFWGPNEVFVGLSSSSGNSTQKCNVHSWSLKLRPVPYWMHSEPLDPSAFVEKKKEVLKVHQKSDCALKILAALIFGTGCGALGAFVVLFVWTILWNKRPVVPEDFAVQPVEFKFKNKKVVDKSIEDGKN
ncbi:hypothetical protein M9H77_03887 [Catharanthus roseus]|uniref:Uncharacterized protein n=1 Tax=Catharanthus roseus TaxID=4058 RepID=A0ACC0CCP7_CATRO|nr:hypothetical protein M9H77_03887 [Catharanthus roseus]